MDRSAGPLRIRRTVLRTVVRSRFVRRRLLGLLGAAQRAADAAEKAYQPVDVLGIDVDPATRWRISARWEAMRPHIEQQDPRTALDIGAAEGFYAMRLAELGLSVVALEAKERPSRVLRDALAVGRIEGVAQLRMTITPSNVTMLPNADVVLLLAVWHHWVRIHGLDTANAMLGTVWARTGRILLFETGERMPAHYGLPDPGPDPARTFGTLLGEVCADARIEALGRFPDRTLFAVTRVR